MKRRMSQKGFTLIEIIAVLVLLGILAAVAVPRYINLQDDAKELALDGAISAGVSNVSLVFAQSILSTTGTVPTMVSLAGSLNSGYTDVGDFTVSYDPVDDTGIKVTVTASDAFDLPSGTYAKTVTLKD